MKKKDANKIIDSIKDKAKEYINEYYEKAVNNVSGDNAILRKRLDVIFNSTIEIKLGLSKKYIDEHYGDDIKDEDFINYMNKVQPYYQPARHCGVSMFILHEAVDDSIRKAFIDVMKQYVLEIRGETQA